MWLPTCPTPLPCCPAAPSCPKATTRRFPTTRLSVKPISEGSMPEANDTQRLSVKGLNAFYGESHVLHGINIHVGKGELVTLLGRNGAGKTYTFRAIMGPIERQGVIPLDGKELTRQA